MKARAARDDKPRKRTSNLFRVLASGLISTIISVVVLTLLARFAGVDLEDPARAVVTSYVVAWPLHVIIYVSWSYTVYSKLRAASLRQLTASESRDEQRPLDRMLSASGATNSTISAAVVAVVVTVLIAQQPEFRDNPIYVGMTLLTVASSWVLMVFSFGQSYLRLGAKGAEDAHFRFHFRETPLFSDYLNLALMISASGATVSADATSRAAWRVVRTNVIIAFAFNSVIVAMMVSLLFGGITG